MPAITFIAADGTELTRNAASGASVMQAARDGGIDGIVAECGGGMACATCHVMLSPEVARLFPPASKAETEMLEMTADPATGESRLSCQLIVTAAMPDFSVRLPQRQV